ncbi:hypothetical protein ACFWP3_37940 [Streptomyces sp. NPDC058525]|uniref:hypothetical protein n=1 Tax=Streptomyces sp. NPDC058525 TaxID=3346538 RepID=UPI003648BE68
MKTPTRAVLTTAAVPLLALVLAACGSSPTDSPGTSGQPTPPQQQPNGRLDGGDVRGDDGPAPNLPDGWLESMQEYADCLNQNGAQDIKVDKARGGLDLNSALPPEAVQKCLSYNPVSTRGGAKEKRS